MRARALRAPVFLSALPRQTGRCAPHHPSQLLCFIFISQKIINLLFPETKASFRPELGPPGSNIFPLDHRGFEIQYNIPRPSPHLSHPSKLHCTLLSFFASWRAMLHPIELCCTLLSYAAPHWAMLHPRGATMYPTKLLSYTALYWAKLRPSEVSCTLVSYAGLFWDTLHPIELRCTLLSYAAPYWAMLHPSELSCTLLSYAAPFWTKLHPSELRCTLLSYALSFWATLDPTELRWTPILLRCTQKNIFSPPPP